MADSLINKTRVQLEIERDLLYDEIAETLGNKSQKLSRLIDLISELIKRECA